MERGQHLFHAGLLGVPSTDRDALDHASLGRRAMQSAPRLFLDHTDRHPVPRLDLLELFDEILTDFQHDGLPFVGQELDLQRPILDIDLDHLFGDEIEPILLDPRTALADLNQFGCSVSHSHSPVPYVVGGTQPRLDSAPSAVSRTMSFSSSSSGRRSSTARRSPRRASDSAAFRRTNQSSSRSASRKPSSARLSPISPSASAAWRFTIQLPLARPRRSPSTARGSGIFLSARAASSRTVWSSRASISPSTARGSRSFSKANTAACRTAPSRSLTAAVRGAGAGTSSSHSSRSTVSSFFCIPCSLMNLSNLSMISPPW